MAKDAADKKTTDAFARGRGRPRTATPEKTRADTAERQRRFRARQALKIEVANNIALDKTNSHWWVDFFRSLNGQQTELQNPVVQYKLIHRPGPRFTDGTWSDIERVFLERGQLVHSRMIEIIE